MTTARLLSAFPITDPTLIFFVVLLIVLFAPIIMSKLRIPHIIGMVLAGVVFGQYGFDILERDGSFELFGRVGLFYIMFLAGLEMDLQNVKRNSRQFLIFGLLTCFVPLGLTFVMSTLLLHYTPQASFLLGCIMASNTLIAYPIIGRYGLQRHPSVALSVGSSMISLFLALVMIAALASSFTPSAAAETATAAGITLGILFFLLKLAAYIAASALLIPRLTRYFLRRYSDSVMQYIFVLSVMFCSAALSAFIGLEGIFGAFLSGLILNRYIPHVSPLMNRIEFIGNALFIPYFLIGVGMLINVRTLFQGGQVLWVVFLIAFFGTFGKAVAAYLSALLFRLTKTDGHMMFGLTSAHAAGAIAMIMVGMRLEIAPGQYLVNDDMLNGVIMMILVTCVISTLMTEHAAQQTVIKNLSPGPSPKERGASAPNGASDNLSPNPSPKERGASAPNGASDNLTPDPSPKERGVSDSSEVRKKGSADSPLLRRGVGGEVVLLCVKYPDIAPALLNLALLIRAPQSTTPINALNVVYDDEHNAVQREQGMRLLEQLQRQAAAADVPMQTQVRLATNIANGIKHAFKEYACSEIIMGMHVHTEANPRFWGDFIQSLYNGLSRQILLVRFVQPLNTLRRIKVAVPSRAEFEPGFQRWLERLCRLAGNLDCRIEFHGREESLVLINEYINNYHPSIRADLTPMAHWNELPQLASTIADDHLFVVVTARRGTISYKNALDRLPNELQRYFSGRNLMIVFPDQYGDQKEDTMSFTEAQHREETSLYDSLLSLLHKARHHLSRMTTHTTSHTTSHAPH